VELARSLLALVDGLETAAGCDSAVVSPFKFARSPSLRTERQFTHPTARTLLEIVPSPSLRPERPLSTPGPSTHHLKMGREILC
jgi:hypothetical protein